MSTCCEIWRCVCVCARVRVRACVVGAPFMRALHMVSLFSSGEWFIHGRCVTRWGLTGRQEPLPAAVNGRHGDRGLPKRQPPQAAVGSVDGRLTSDLHKWLRDSLSELRLIAAVTQEATKAQVSAIVLEGWIPPGPHTHTCTHKDLCCHNYTQYIFFISAENLKQQIVSMHIKKTIIN